MKQLVSLSLFFLLVSFSRCGGPELVPLSAFNPVAALSDDCDAIRLTRSQTVTTGPGSVAIELATGSGSPWWKEIRCEIRSTGRTCGRLHANDGPSTAPGEIVLLPSELNDARLIFTKPKFLGRSTDVYQIIELAPLGNNRALFTWERDRCP